MDTPIFTSEGAAGQVQNRTRAPRPPRGESDSLRRGRGQGERGRGQGGRARGGRGKPDGLRTDGGKHQEANAGIDAESRPEPTKPQSTNEEALVDDVEAEVCFICASPVVHNSVGPCNHRTCHICALRLRALYKNKACAHCRTEAQTVIFTDDPTKRFEDFGNSEFAKSDDNLGIKYEKNEIFEDTVILLRYNCPDESCDVACYGWPDLHRHVKGVHHKAMCDLCTRNKKVFTHEHELFTPAELKNHEKFGDDNPGAIDQSGFKGHPECGFCRQRFYGDDELYAHCRDKHEKCHICDRRNQGRQQQYFLNYDALEVHFKKDHFSCPDQECLDKKFVVFDSEMDLKAHQLEAHPNGLSKDARRDARRVNMSSFDYRTPHQEPRPSRRENRGDREGRGRGRGRDPNVEALPVSSAQPMGRAELAYQRQMAIHSAQSISNRNFGGALTSGDTYIARPPPNTSEPATVTAPRESSQPTPPSLESLHVTIPEQTGPQTPQERARALRHTAVLERASILLQNDSTKLGTFRAKISAYRTSAVTASQLIDTFFVLFDTSSSELGKLINELAEIFEVLGKRDNLLKAWNDWRAINEDYPSLPGPNGAMPSVTNTGAGGGKRILKLKSSTAQSSRSVTSRHASWGSAGPPPQIRGPTAGTASNAFPGLAISSANRIGAGKVGPTPWVSANSTVSSGSSTPRVTTAPISRPAAKPTSQGTLPAGATAFPALPMAQKPGMNVSRPGFFGNPVLRTDTSGRGTPLNAWAGGSGHAPFGSGEVDVSEEEGGKGNKGKGKKKQTLYHWG